MKNKILIIFVALLLVIPFGVFASESGAGSNYKSTNLIQTFASEGIAIETTNYKETDDQIPIYLFRGNGCGFCQSFLNYLNSILKDYGKYFKLVSYEVWYDQKNNQLLTDVSSFMGSPATGVPYIVIGDQVFPGYNSDYDEQIKTAIKTLYESEERYDVFEAMEEANGGDEATFNSKDVVFWNVASTAVGTAVILAFIYYNNRKINSRLDDLEKKKKSYK